MALEMKQTLIQLESLPDEILLMTLRRLDHFSLLYSFFDLNQRLNQIVLDSHFTKQVSLIRLLSNGALHSLPYPMLGRFCLHILPVIHDRITRLNLETFTIKLILSVARFPNLSQLALYNIKVERALAIFTGKSFQFHVRCESRCHFLPLVWVLKC